jgi:hypothetical protein
MPASSHFGACLQGFECRFLPLEWVPSVTSVATFRDFSGNTCHSSGFPLGLQCLT